MVHCVQFDNNKMKIYLLILTLVFLSSAKFRHLSNISIMTTSPPLIKSLTPNELAIQYGNTAITLNISNQAVLQTIALPTQSTIQLLPSQSLLLYINQNTIYQTHPTSAQYDLAFTSEDQDGRPPISSFGSLLVVPAYGDKAQIKLIGPNPWNSKTLLPTPLDGENVKGGSDINFVSQKEFYFASGGVCNGEDGALYLYKSDGTNINKIHEFPLKTCSFDEDNRQWCLDSFRQAEENYHLLIYASQSSVRSRWTSQVISNINGEIKELGHFETDKPIGVAVGSSSAAYTADNLFCRVVEYDFLNHQHEHLPSYFQTTPKRTFVSMSENFIISIAPYYNVENADSAILQRIEQDGKFSPGESYGISTETNVRRGELLQDFYLVMTDDSVEAPLSIWDIQSPPQTYTTNLKGVVDFCVSNMNAVFVLTSKAGIQTLGVYKMVQNVFTLHSSLQLVSTFTSLNCLDDNNVLLTPSAGIYYVFQYTEATGITEISNKQRNPKIHASFNYVQNILIFTSEDSTQTTFYDYDFIALPLSFNLPPNSVFKILEPRKDGVVIAIGSEIGQYSSLEYYKVANSVITYAGTFPYLDDGVADLAKTVLFSARGILHIQYEKGSTEWATYFDLTNPPQKAIGYFFDDKEKDCSLYDFAAFRFLPNSKEMIVLNKNNDAYPIIEKYLITDKLTKIESYPLTQYKNTLAKIRISSNSNELIVSGINAVNRNYRIEVRNADLLSKVIYVNQEHSSLDGKMIQSSDVVNGMVASFFADQKEDEDAQNLNIYFRASTQSEIAVDNYYFSAVTLIATCPNCNSFAFTGTPKIVTNNPAISVSDYVNPSASTTFTVTCQPDLLAVAPGGNQLAWKCPTKEVFAYDLTTKTATPVTATFTTMTELSFLDDKTLLANIDGAIQRVPIVAAKQIRLSLSAGVMSSYAIDYSRGIYAVATNATTIQIYSIDTNEPIDAYNINNNVDISSLSFASNGDLIVAKSTGTVIILTQLPCSNDKDLVDGFCVCKQLYQQNGDQCQCDYVRQDDGSCVCDDGYYFNGNDKCNSCSAMCSTCKSDGAFDCQDYSAWFFIIIIGSILIVGGGVLVLVFKLKKRKEKADTMYTEDKSKLSEPFVSERQKSESEQVMRKSAKE